MEVKAQFGEVSNELQALGLKKKSEYQSPPGDEDSARLHATGKRVSQLRFRAAATDSQARLRGVRMMWGVT